ncbi:MAG: hypothetical protein O3B01_30160, partial [Planctomycetota bacterium]|nr:hypothetical protein [Planctomycetota bacterium]
WLLPIRFRRCTLEARTTIRFGMRVPPVFVGTRRSWPGRPIYAESIDCRHVDRVLPPSNRPAHFRGEFTPNL